MSLPAAVVQHVNHAQAGGADPYTIDISGTIAGNALLLDIFVNDGRTVVGITDTQGNFWSAVQSVTDGSLQIIQWKALNIVGGVGANTITVDFDGGTASVGMACREITGVKTVAAEVGHTGQPQTTPGTAANAVTSGATTPSAYPALILGTGAHSNGAAAPAAGSGFTSDGTGDAWYASYQYRLESQRITSGSQAATFTAGNAADNFISLVVAFAELSAGTQLDRNPLVNNPLTGVLVQ